MSRRRRQQKRPYSAENPSNRVNGVDPNPRQHSPAGWLFIGVVLGLALSLYYAWVINPVVYTNANPERLSEAYQRDYIVLVSQSYAQNDNWAEAEWRLAQLRDPNLVQTVGNLLDAEVKAQNNPELIRNLATMARQLGVQGQAVAIFAPTLPPNDLLPTPTIAAGLIEETAVSVSDILTPTAAQPLATSIPTATPIPTRVATATPQPNYRLLDQVALCEGENITHIEVVTVDAFLNEIAGVEVLVATQENIDHFFTGFKPEKSIGYGDFEMERETSYSVKIADGSPEVSGLRIETCDSGLAGGWRLTFQNLIFGATPTPTIDEEP